MTQNEYYVYIYLREDGTPYYVGKGKNKRAYQKHQFVPVPKTDDRIIFVHTNLSENDALEKESELILQYGRKNNDTGILRNLTDGGEGTSGYKFTPEQRIASSIRTKEVANRLEMKARVSELQKEVWKTRPRNRPEHSLIMKEIWAKKTDSGQTKAAWLKDASKGSWSNPEEKKRRIDALHSLEVSQKRIASQNTPEYKAKLSKRVKEQWARKKAEKLQAYINLGAFWFLFC